MKRLEQLADRMQSGSESGIHYYVAAAEFERRKAILQRKAKHAEAEAAKADILTAEHTKRNARYMLFSVIVLTIASVASLVAAICTWRFPDQCVMWRHSCRAFSINICRSRS